MPYLTEDQAAAEVSKWEIEFKDLKPALVTRQDLWNLYKSSNSEWAANICELGVSAATAALTGSGAFNVLNWVADVVTEVAKSKAVEIAGAHMTDFEEDKGSYKLEANKKFATKLASGFLTILVSAAGGALTAVTGGGAAIVTAIAIIVWIGDCEEAELRGRWDKIVNSMMKKYDNIRQRKLQQINVKHRTELEKLVMSNAQHDLEDAGLVKTYTWKSDNQSNVARYPTSKLKQLLERMQKFDRELGKQLWVIDLLEISRVYHTETVALWDAIERQMGLAQNLPQARPAGDFNEAKMKAFMRRQIECHAGLGEVPTTKAEQKLMKLREQALSKYGAVEVDDGEDCDIPDEHSA